ncbi:MAG TPA: acyl-CoA thioesterase domain-containing protein [Humibacillus xanthopallidus]|nr:acyl-CoA thioesterase domain-containing protein [Humibacillus xanthopallidus]
MTQRVSGLVDLLDLRRESETTWLGRTDTVRLPHLYGGQLVAQSVVAAGRTAGEERPVHSIHTTFLRAGRPGEPVRFVAETLRTGGLITTLDVGAWQGERLLCRSTVSCSALVDGLTHQRPAPPSAGADASTDLRDVAEATGGLGDYWEEFAAIELRVDPVLRETHPAHSASPPSGIWMRSREPLPDDPLVHRATIAYASDLMLMSTAVTPHGHTTGHERSLAARWRAVSLDHAIWFHREARADSWLLFDHATPAAHASRALIEATAFDADGGEVCHVAQEALIRPHAG